ncbi:hypothetical protein SESBI_22603 [Sesbania bispinosa]|nr:hypothetical protein SESBI_22603 [Sesbania bispinosa]
MIPFKSLSTTHRGPLSPTTLSRHQLLVTSPLRASSPHRAVIVPLPQARCALPHRFHREQSDGNLHQASLHWSPSPPTSWVAPSSL